MGEFSFLTMLVSTLSYRAGKKKHPLRTTQKVFLIIAPGPKP